MTGKPFVLLPVMFLVASCARQATFHESELQANDPRTSGVAVQDVRWGYHGDQLLFVIFQTSINGESHTEFKVAPIPDPATTPGHLIVPVHDHWIQLPDGSRKELPSSRTMFEYDSGGTFTNRPIDVTLDEFRQWIATGPRIYSIEKLEEFVARHRKQK